MIWVWEGFVIFSVSMRAAANLVPFTAARFFFCVLPEKVGKGGEKGVCVGEGLWWLLRFVANDINLMLLD